MRRIVVKLTVLVSLFLLIGGERGFAADAVKTAGDVLMGVLPSVACGLTLDRNDPRGTEQLSKSLGATVVVTLALKYTIHETRPNGGKHSFPSGHTSVAFSSAEFMRNRYGWKWGLPAYAAAIFVGFSRVEARQHFFHDVLVGAIIGYVGSSLFTEKRLDKRPILAPSEEPYLVNVTCSW